MMSYPLALTLLLSGFWLLLSGRYDSFSLFLGALSVFLVLTIVLRMQKMDHDYHPLLFRPKIFSYFIWLFGQVIKANLAVVRCIWMGNKTIDPVIVSVTAGQHTSVGKVIYANSITLTPGTVTINMNGSKFTIHALTREAANELLAGEMDRRIRALEKK